MLIFDYLCGKCGHEQERVVKRADDEVYCAHCEALCDRLPSSFGGYGIKGDNSASVRPRNAGYRPKKG